MNRIVWILAQAVLLWSLLAATDAGAELPLSVHKTIQSQCLSCHGEGAEPERVRLDQLSMNLANADVMRQWVRVHDRVQKREMPPKAAAKLPDSERGLLLKALAREISAADAKQPPERVRRLNRVEYEHTLQDLLALPSLNVKEMLPEDGQQHGFDKVAGGLEISPIHMAKYLQVADHVLRQAMIQQATSPEKKVWREQAIKLGSVYAAIKLNHAVPLNGREIVPDLQTHIMGNAGEDFANCYRIAKFKGESESVALLNGVKNLSLPGGLVIDGFDPPVGGWYKVRVSIWGLRWDRTQAGPARLGKARRHIVNGKPYLYDEKAQEWVGTKLEKPSFVGWTENVDFYGDGEFNHVVRASLAGKPLAYLDAPSLKPTTHELKVWLNPGDRVAFHGMTLPAYGPNTTPEYDGVRAYEGPGIAFDWFEVEGPFIDEWPPLSHQRLFGKALPPGDLVKTKDQLDNAATIVSELIRSFANQAFRRPVSQADVQPFVDLVTQQLDRGHALGESLLSGYQALLCSPEFLLVGLEENTPSKSSNNNSADLALASRLSYFLWNSLPDQTLLDVAVAGKLRQPAVLRSQVERMLSDPRSDRFVDHFLDEWLDLKKIDFTMPDPQLYPEFDPWLRDSLLAEPRLTFRQLIAKDAGVRHLIKSDFVIVDQRLAEHYGLRGITGGTMRAVPLPESSPRGGFLTQAAVLKVTANGTSTSPILRGVWVTERLLGIPRSPPPANIPAIEPDASGAVTIRQIIEKHRADPSCAACHAKSDPAGFALEQFDVIGGKRDRYRLSGKPKPIGTDADGVEEPTVSIVVNDARDRYRIRLGSVVDASGQLESGDKFDDLAGLQKLLLKDEEAVARNLVRQLMVYATGVGIRFSDRSEIESVLTRTRGKQHGIRSLIHEVVQSKLFQQATGK